MTENRVSKVKVKEWNSSKRWNPFNSYKLLAHVQRWKRIRRGKPIPPPVLITVDPTNLCNLNCVWCNAEFIRNERKSSLSKKILLDIADFLPKWGEGVSAWKPGVEAICVAGGGEPLLNPATAQFIDRVIENGIEVGVVTNGTLIEDYIDSLSQCTWVGVSVDAGTSDTYNKLKRLSPQKRTFENVVNNIVKLVNYSKRYNSRLGAMHPSYGVSFKYLLYNKDNIGEIYQATKLAKDIGCKNIHFRPAGTTWDKLGSEQEISFSKEDISLFQQQIQKALELDDDNFNVYGVTHKFSSQFNRANYFSNCYAIFMTAVIEPPSINTSLKDTYVMGLCCDRRGDPKLELIKDETDIGLIQNMWGSKKHWNILDAIDVKKECPRCTYQPHNEIYEQVILNDSMTYKFI